MVRVAVPDFAALAELYVVKRYPLYPRILGRIVGEQDYKMNKHACIFDRNFLEKCLTECGFEDIAEWCPTPNEFARDGSFDEIDGVKTSLNLQAKKPIGLA